MQPPRLPRAPTTDCLLPLGSCLCRCLFKEDVLLEALQFKRPFNIDMGILVGYLLVLHVLTFVGLLVLARGERR